MLRKLVTITTSSPNTNEIMQCMSVDECPKFWVAKIQQMRSVRRNYTSNALCREVLSDFQSMESRNMSTEECKWEKNGLLLGKVSVA